MRRTLLLMALMNVVTAFCGVTAWVYRDGPYAAFWGMWLTVGLVADMAWFLSPRLTRERHDYLTASERYREQHVATGQFKGSRAKAIFGKEHKAS